MLAIFLLSCCWRELNEHFSVGVVFFDFLNEFLFDFKLIYEKRIFCFALIKKKQQTTDCVAIVRNHRTIVEKKRRIMRTHFSFVSNKFEFL
jgi:hypothetical protein